jgi:cytochrome c6
MSFLSRKIATALAGILLLSSGASQGADSFKGRQLYAANCAMCHGPTGKSTMPGAPNFNRGEKLMRPDGSLLASIRSGTNACPSFRGMLPDRDILDVIAFLRTLQ